MEIDLGKILKMFHICEKQKQHFFLFIYMERYNNKTKWLI